MPRGLVAMTTIPTFLGEASADSVIRRVAISAGQNIYTPEDTFTPYPIYDDRPYAAWLYASFALQYTYKRHDSATGRDDADPPRYAPARSRRDRAGRRR